MLFLFGFHLLSLFMNITYSSSLVGAASQVTQYVRYQEPEFLTFDELLKLTEDPHPGGRLETKLKNFWETPIISNEAWYNGTRPRKIINEKIGHVLRVASWNIEKSFNVGEVIQALKYPAAYINRIDPAEVTTGSQVHKRMLQQRERLLQADILILQEMDIGHKRSGYINAAAELAKALDMNYTYGAQQLEIDPVYLGTDKIHTDEGADDKEATEEFAADPKLYKGVFGSAVLSRYPIKRVRVFQLKNQPYDWYHGEKPKIAHMESFRRLGTKFFFKNEMTRELKVGGRIFFRVDLDVPELPGGTLTVINVHLEIKCMPAGRAAQMSEILSYIREIENPVIMMGDFNAAPTDISPTSASRIVKRSVKKPSTWFNAAITFLTPYGPVNTLRGISNSTRNLQDPTASHVPLLAPNSLKEMFQMIEYYRFYDGGAFDFRGDKERSVGGKSKKLANSNQRDLKGFKTTFQVKRPIAHIFGKLRLDWVFVKSYLKDAEDESGPYKFAPHYGETLEDFNTKMMEAFSDHHPNVVDLPFEEPKLKSETTA
jgi:endonuclease/exonuclease/phosphatase family metal-dependent hydrolase